MAAKTVRKRLYIIGVDAAPLWLIKEHYKSHRLDGFTKFLEGGALTDLESTMPPMTGPSWPSMYTGFRPGETGTPEFFTMTKDYRKEIAFYNPDIKAPFWDKLARGKGLRSLVITPAMLVKPTGEPKVDMITGFPLPAKFSSQKVRDVADKCSFRGEPEDTEAKMKDGSFTLEQASKSYADTIEKRGRVARELIEKNDYDLCFICFTETDRMQHFSLNNPKWREYVLPLYERISDFLLWIQERARSEYATVLLVSDHGAQPIKEKFLVNGWLINNGYAKLQPALEASLGSAGKASVKYTVRERLMKSSLRKKVYEKLPSAGKKLAKTVLVKGFAGTSGEDYTRIHDFDFDMTRTTAFATISNGPICTIYLNDSRFQNGIVGKDRQALKEELMDSLLKITDREGKPLIVATYDADKYYEGTRLFIAPDIMAEVREDYFLDTFGYRKSGELFAKPELAKSGDHLKNGIFGVIDYRSAVDYQKVKRNHLYVYNVAPTVLKYFDYKPDNDKRYGPIF